MTYSNELDNFALPLPITRTAVHVAEQFAKQQPTPEKAEQVRLNTLAVCVVNDYLQLMGIPTDLSAGDSWNPITRLCADVADLEIVGVGRLECRPVRSNGATAEPSNPVQLSAHPTCPIPPEVWEDRIGYVVVDIAEPDQEASILGFVETAAVEALPLSQLHSPEALIDHLDQLMSPVAVPQAVAQSLSDAAPVTPVSSQLVNLSRWLQSAFDAGWETVESLLNPSELNLAYGFRGQPETHQPEGMVRRAKLIDLGMQLVDRPVTLVVELMPESDDRTTICLQVHPGGGQAYLPSGLELTVLDDAGTTFLEAQSREADNYIQLQFSGSPGEPFKVRVSLGDASVVEDFVI
jgi:hypothetical protein